MIAETPKGSPDPGEMECRPSDTQSCGSATVEDRASRALTPRLEGSASSRLEARRRALTS